MTITEKRVWIINHGGMWFEESETPHGLKTLCIWYAHYGFVHFQGIGDTEDQAVDELFDLVHDELMNGCNISVS